VEEWVDRRRRRQAPQAPNRLKGTMVGVAPMAGGNPMGGPPHGMNAPVAAPQPGGYPMQPGMPQGMQGMPHGAPQQAPRTPPPPGMPEMGAAYSPPVPQPGVNPLGGTVAADGQAFNQAFGPPPGQGGMNYGAPPPQGTALMPGMGAPPYGASPYGAPQGQASGSGNPPPYDQGMGANPYGAPPPNPFAGPPPGYNAGPSGAPPGGMGMGNAPQAMVPYGQAGGSAPSASLAPANVSPGGVLYGVVPGSTSAPVRRNAAMALIVPLALWFGGTILANILARIIPGLAFLGSLVSLAGSIYAFLLLITMANEVKSVTRNASFAWWPILIPFYNCYWLWIVLPKEVAQAKQVLGVQRATRSILAYIFIPTYALAADVNDLVR
jgi:hypothetical protein